jgi:hypothetical protein
MHTVKVQILRFTASEQPGWVECALRDTTDREWTFVDKVSVFTEVSLGTDSFYPQPGFIACEIIRQWMDDQGRTRCLIDTQHPWGVSAKSGENQFEVFVEQIATGTPGSETP